MTPSEFLLKILVLSANAEKTEDAAISYTIDLEDGVISGEFSFPVEIDSTNGDLKIKTTDWLKADFSALQSEEIE